LSPRLYKTDAQQLDSHMSNGEVDKKAQTTTIDPIHFSFSGHETFPFRYTWLPKGILYTEKYHDLFLREDALVILGVGKNMVQSIRHWCETVGLIDSQEKGTFSITQLGQKLLGSDGWDLYLENLGTLWLIHWLLVRRPEKASTWYLAFTCWNTEEFTREKLTNWLWKKVIENPGTRATHSSLKRDVDVFLRTYVPARVTGTRPLEDSFDCPLVELGLITELDGKTFQFSRGHQPSLPDDIFIYALIDYWQLNAPKQNTLSFEKLLHGEGSPGAAFRMSENALVERLERLPTWSQLVYDDTAGMRTVLRRNPPVQPILALEHYYTKNSPVSQLTWEKA
jgi:hypothetical protein